MSESKANIDNVPAIILCGGLSKRMGQDKAQLPFGPNSMLHAVERTFSTQGNRVIVVAGYDQSAIQPASDFTTLLRDESPGLGPLEGLRVGLTHASQFSDYALVATCDSPLAKYPVYELMYSQIDPGVQAIIPAVNDRPHPLTAVYEKTVLTAIEEMLGKGDLKVRNLMNQIRFASPKLEDLKEVDPDLQTFENINTPDEYRTALTKAGLDEGRS